MKNNTIQYQDETENPGDVIILPVKAIRCGPVSFGEKGKHFRALIKSIEKGGSATPVCVVKTKRGKYEIVAGRQRLAASIRAGIKEVAAIICSPEEEKETMLGIIRESEGVLNYFEEGDYFKKIIDSGLYTQKTLAERIGKSQSYVSNKMRLSRIPLPVRKKIIEGGLTERHARAILRIGDEKVQRFIVDMALEQELGVEEMEERIKELLDLSNHDLSKEYLLLAERFKAERDMVNGKRSAAGSEAEANAGRLRLLIKTVKELVDISNRSGLYVIAGQRNTDKNVEIVIKIPRAENDVSLKSDSGAARREKQYQPGVQGKTAA